MPQSRDSKRNTRLTRTHAQLDDAQQHTHQVKDDQLTVNTPNTWTKQTPPHYPRNII